MTRTNITGVCNILQALNGFLFIVSCEGEVFFASNTVEQYLGFHQVCDGSAVFTYSVSVTRLQRVGSAVSFWLCSYTFLKKVATVMVWTARNARHYGRRTDLCNAVQLRPHSTNYTFQYAMRRHISKTQKCPFSTPV